MHLGSLCVVLSRHWPHCIEENNVCFLQYTVFYWETLQYRLNTLITFHSDWPPMAPPELLPTVTSNSAGTHKHCPVLMMLGLVAEVFASRAIFGVSSRALFYSNLTTTLQGFWETEAWSLLAGIQMQVFCSRAHWLHWAPGMCWREGSEVRHAVLGLPGTSVPQFPYLKKE